MSGLWISNLINVFSLNFTFLLPLFSDGAKLYFQHIDDKNIAYFEETSLDDYEGSDCINVRLSNNHLFHPGDVAVYSIQIGAKKRAIADATSLLRFYNDNKQFVPFACALYDNMQHFKEQVVQRSETTSRMIRQSDICFIQNNKKSNTVTAFFSQETLHLSPTQYDEITYVGVGIARPRISTRNDAALRLQATRMSRAPGTRSVKISVPLGNAYSYQAISMDCTKHNTDEERIVALKTLDRKQYLRYCKKKKKNN